MRYLSLFVLLLMVAACIDPFTKTYTYNTNLLMVEALLTDKDPFFVSLMQSRSTQQTEYQQPITKATVQLILGNGTTMTLRESATIFGRYDAPETFRGQAGQAYRLRIRMTDGKLYESSLEKLTAAPPIEKVYFDFDKEGITNTDGSIVASSVNVSVDAPEDGQTLNYYQWRTFLYETQRICGSCANGQWNLKTNDCDYYRFDPPPMPPYLNDYECEQKCWQIYLDERLNIFSDALTNGKPIQKRLVKKVPFYKESHGALLEIHQMSISQTVFRYFNLLKQQSESSGTITDVPPSPPVGNIRNVNNAEEPVAGYFGAVGINKQKVWIDRTAYTNIRYTTKLGGRDPVLESGDPYTSLPKFFKVPCIASRHRTPTAPEGWKF